MERFTERAVHVVASAEAAARLLRHDHVGTAHILLGLLDDHESLAASVLTSLPVTADRVRAEAVMSISPSEVTSGTIPLTQRAQRVLELAPREALSLGHDDVRPEHILLAIVGENGGVGARILHGCDAGPAQIRREVLRRLAGPLRRPAPHIDRGIDYETGDDAPTLSGVWRHYQTTGDHRARERLLLVYSPLVKYVAGRMSSSLPAHVEESDLIAYGLAGLISAIEHYEPAREGSFESYAITRIRGTILDELRTLDWVPGSVRGRARDIELANRTLEARFHRPATDEEMATELEISTEDFHDALIQISRSTIVAVEPLWNAADAGGDQVSLLDTLPDTHPQSVLDAGERHARIADAVAALPEREKLVLALYYEESLTLREIGEVLRVRESHVAQLHTKAVLRVRSKLARESD